jgi:hypothetical protein
VDINEFLSILEKNKDYFSWRLVNKDIVGVDSEGRSHDVITAVFYIITHGWCPIWKSRRITRKLNLLEHIRCSIVRADCGFCMNKTDMELRKKLLKILNL